MSGKIEHDSVTGRETTGHEWDGIKELNRPLPKWWLWVLYVCVAWSVVYWLLFPAWPLGTFHTGGLLGYSARTDLDSALAEARKGQEKYLNAIAATPVEQIRNDPQLFNFALAGGRALFAQNCQPCHGASGQGGPGYPVLVDDDWLWGGTQADIYQTIQHGIRAANDDETRQMNMPRFGADGLLQPDQINDVAEFVLSLSNRATDPAAAQRGAPVFAENCAVCHGDKGEGNQAVGAPTLSDQIWLYGGDKKDIVHTITFARNSVMPSWSKRLDDVSIKQLAVYVHELGGGK